MGTVRKYRIACVGDEADLGRLMERMPVSIAGVRHPSLARAVCHEACRARGCFIVLALHHAEPVGYSLVITNWSSFRVCFLARHPLIAVRVVAAVLKKSVRNHSRVRNHGASFAAEATRSNAVAEAPPRGPRWSDAGRGIAKVFYTAVVPEHRRSGVASGLKRAYIKRVRELGMVRLDARISRENTASIELNRRSGWELHEEGDYVLAVLHIR